MTEDLKARLLKSRVGERTIEIPGVGQIRVRGLSRGEVLLLQKSAGNPTQLEQKILAIGMVDPALSEKDAVQWQKSANAGEIEMVVEAINELSGLVQGAQKSDLPGDGERV